MKTEKAEKSQDVRSLKSAQNTVRTCVRPNPPLGRVSDVSHRRFVSAFRFGQTVAGREKGRQTFGHGSP